MFNVGGPEILVIIVVALIVLGPDQLPKAMRTFGNVMAEIRKVSDGFQSEMRNAMDTFTDDDSPPAKPAQTSDQPALAATPEDADVTEIVARNTGAAAGGLIEASGVETDPDATVDPHAGVSPVDPADRAAG